MESDALVTVSENREAIVFTPIKNKATKALVYYQGANEAPQSFAYAYPKHFLRDKAVKVLTLSGSYDGLATPSDIEEGKTLLPPDTSYLVIPRGNHTQFALYGNGDNKTTLPAMEQQKMVIDATIALLLQGRQ